MTYVISTRARPSNKAALVEGFNGLAKPRLLAQGATRVDALEWLTGEGVGTVSGVSQWESLNDGITAVQSVNADPEIVAALAASPVEVVGRIIGVVEASTGPLDGEYVGIVMMSIASPDPGRISALVDLTMEGGGPVGIKGAQMIRVFAGPGTGMYFGAVAMDDVNAFPEASAAVREQLAEHFAAMNGAIVERLLTKVH